MERKVEFLRFFQAQAFPSWQSKRAFGGGVQSEAVPKSEGPAQRETVFGTCSPHPKAEVSTHDGKAAEWDGMMVLGGGDAL